MTMPRYIDADALIVQMQKNCLGCALHEKDPECRACAWGDAENLIDNAPTADVVEKERYIRVRENADIMADALSEYQSADVVEVVRCKDCKKHDWCSIEDMALNDETFFCKWGERKEE